jgi:hypothetical protein
MGESRKDTPMTTRSGGQRTATARQRARTARLAEQGLKPYRVVAPIAQEARLRAIVSELCEGREPGTQNPAPPAMLGVARDTATALIRDQLAIRSGRQPSEAKLAAEVRKLAAEGRYALTDRAILEVVRWDAPGRPVLRLVVS